IRAPNSPPSRSSSAIASFSAARGRTCSHVAYFRGDAPFGKLATAFSIGPGNSACASKGAPSAASFGNATRKSASVTCANSSTPLGTRKHLNPKTPASHSAGSSSEFPGTTPPQNPVSTQSFPAAAASFSRNAAAVVVAGMLFSGISIKVVTPPAAAARVAVENPSQSARPGSLMCTCVSTTPGITTKSPASCTVLPEGISPYAETAAITPARTCIAAARSPSGVITRFPRTIRSAAAGALREVSEEFCIARSARQCFHKFRQQIPRHIAPVTRRRAHIVNRRNLRAQRVLRSLQSRALRPLPAQYLFGAHRAQHRRPHAPQRNAHIRDSSRLHPRRRRKTNLRDRLRPPRSHFAKILFPPGMLPRQTNPPDQFPRVQVHFLVLSVKRRVMYPARPGRRNNFNFRVVNDQRRWRIGGRRSIRDVAAQCSAILRRHAPRLSSGAAQQRKFARQNLIPLDFSVSRQSSQCHMLRASFY